MNILDIITKKKNKKELTKEEINFFVNGFLNDEVKDYQMSALLMAIVLNGMTDEETFMLTDVMINSGNVLDLSKINGIIVDKHSTGGIGDKTSFVVLPLVASSGVKIAKMSGRTLGFTGGTIDKLESIEGYKTKLTNEEFINQVNDIGIALISQTENLAPADKKIYALRDVSGTTESIPLIASSIMSKKIASGADKILLDVKVGKGAFMKNLDDAKELAKLMVKIGNHYNKETIAILTNMDYPLGNSIGNAVEVREALDLLNGDGNQEFLNLCLTEASYMVSLAKNIKPSDAFDIVLENYKNKKAYNKFLELIFSQGGDVNKIEIEQNKVEVVSDKSGYVSDIDSKSLALLAQSLGAGRMKKEDSINHKVGIILNKKYGDKVEKGDVLFYALTEKNINLDDYKKLYMINDTMPNPIDIIYEIIQ